MKTRVPYGRLIEIQDMLLNSPLNIAVIKNWREYYDDLNTASSAMSSSIYARGRQDKLKVIQDKGYLYIIKVKS